MSNHYDDESFLLVFPLWTLLHPSTKAKGMIHVEADGHKASLIFTDQDLAERFQAELSPDLDGYVLGAMKNAENLSNLFEVLEAQEFTHVAIDPTGLL